METTTAKLLNVNMTREDILFIVNTKYPTIKSVNNVVDCWICGNTDNLYINPKYKFILCDSCYNYHYKLYR